MTQKVLCADTALIDFVLSTVTDEDFFTPGDPNLSLEFLTEWASDYNLHEEVCFRDIFGLDGTATEVSAVQMIHWLGCCERWAFNQVEGEFRQQCKRVMAKMEFGWGAFKRALDRLDDIVIAFEDCQRVDPSEHDEVIEAVVGSWLAAQEVA